MFIKVPEHEFPEFNIEKNKDYFIGGVVPIFDELYRYKNYYVGIEIVDKVKYMSIIKHGTEVHNILKQCSNLVDDVTKTSKVGFMWRKGIKNETLINRLLAKRMYMRYDSNEDFELVVIDKNELLQQL